MAEKRPAAVAKAETIRDAAAQALEKAREHVKTLEREHGLTIQAVRAAQENHDATLPQCRVICVKWRSSKEEERGRAVIVRQTPKGMLVVRWVGESTGDARYKWDGRKFVLARARSTSWLNDSMELRDVPPEYMPKDEVHD
jgi:hypothetical protein